MTARSPAGRVRGRSFASAPDPRGVAEAEVAEAREAVTTMRRLAGERRVGASEVSLAEYRLHRALERVAELDDGPDAA